jgi:multiple sugar transport system permease protein
MATNSIAVPSSGTTTRRRRWRKSGLLRQEMIEGWLFASPFILGFLLWTAYPMILSAMMSFTEWDVLTPAKWNGIANYVKLITDDKLFWLSLYNTAFLTFLGVPIGMVAALATALALNVKTPFTTLYRTLFFLPSQIPGVANAVLWALIFNAQFGILNQLLSPLGIEPINWLFNKHTVKPALIFMGLWGVGGSMMIYLAGLQGIPKELYEAAEIDGANLWRRMRHVTLPLLTPVIFFSLIMGIIGSFQGGFTSVYVMTEGGPANYSLVTMLYIYRQAFNYMHMGYASAFAWLLFFVIMAFTAVQFKMADRWVFYETSK